MGFFKKTEKNLVSCDCIFCGKKITPETLVYARTSPLVEPDEVLEKFTNGFKDYVCPHPAHHIVFSEQNREFVVQKRDKEHGGWPLIVRAKDDRTLADICICPNCHCVLPKGFYMYPKLYIGMLGGKRSGKTSYIVAACKNLENRLHNMGGLGIAKVTVADDSKVYLDYLYKQSLTEAGMAPTDVDEKKPVFPIILLVEPYDSNYEPFFIILQDIPGELMAPQYKTLLSESNIVKSDAFITIIDANMFSETPEKNEWKEARSRRLELENIIDKAEKSLKPLKIEKEITEKEKELVIEQNKKDQINKNSDENGQESPELAEIEERIATLNSMIRKLKEEREQALEEEDFDYRMTEEQLDEKKREYKAAQRKENRLLSDINVENFHKTFINIEDFSKVLDHKPDAVVWTISKLDRWMKSKELGGDTSWSFCKDHSYAHKGAIDQVELDRADTDICQYFSDNHPEMSGMLDILVDQLSGDGDSSSIQRKHSAVASRDMENFNVSGLTEEQAYLVSINTMDPVLQICAWKRLLPVKEFVEETTNDRWSLFGRR